MNIHDILSAIIGTPQRNTPEEVARMAIDRAKLSWSVKAQAHARLDRHIRNGVQIDEALAQVMKWAESRTEVAS